KADLMLIVPATANIIGKIANGIADDMLSTTIMATKSQVVFCPAMNTNMYENPIVQNNIKKLTDYGYSFIDPTSGRLACGDIGRGKLQDTDIIVESVLQRLNVEKDLIGKKVLVTAGPTIVPIDPVRYLTNRSSGKMGYAIAEEARDRGADVILVTGPTSLKVPYGIKVVNITTNKEMHDAVLEEFEQSHIVIKSAAVADYKSKRYSSEKIKKGNREVSLELERDTDILQSLGLKKKHQILVGFAAESSNLLENAKGKLERKNLDYIVANDITSKETGFATDENKVVIIDKQGKFNHLDQMSKREVAKNIFDMIKGR
ncbi:MAG: bifunctional phosphopantothenoylcysteine decarboxylase/phosphopantothenate--cysteine ligase CoaBC, partial [Sarcina sp.]